jgi:predicted AlkP superfamily pyrophosphatase or phosphodiesterase
MPRLLNEIKPYGPIIRKCRVDHIPTLTEPGHAVLSTGRNTGENGIVADCWLDRRSSQKVRLNENVCLDAEPISDSARENGLKVASISGKKNVTHLLGGSKKETFKVYPVFNPKNQEEEAIVEQLRKWNLCYIQGINEWICEVATRVLEEYFGSSHQWYLMVSFSYLDIVGHRYGIDSKEYAETLLKVDELIIKILRQINIEDTLVIIGSDHGATQLTGAIRIDYHKETFNIYTINEEGEDIIDERPIPRTIMENTYYPNGLMPDGGSLRVYVKKPEVVNKVKEAFLKTLDDYIEVSRIYDRRSSIYHLIQTKDERNGDLLIVAKKGMGFLREEWKNVHAEHGSDHEEDSSVPLIILDPKCVLEKEALRNPFPQSEVAQLISECLGLKNTAESCTPSALFPLLHT